MVGVALVVTFALKGKYSTCDEAHIRVGFYPDDAGVGWQVTGDVGDGFPENLGTPTVNMIEYGYIPEAGHVCIKTGSEYEGWLDSLVAAGLVEDTGKRIASRYDPNYAAVCRILDQRLVKPYSE